MDGFRRLGTIATVVAAAVATMFAVAWRAADEHRGLDLADLRSVVLVALVVGIAAELVQRTGRGSAPARRSRERTRPPAERYGPAARAAVVAAQEEAVRLNHERVGTEHLLLGILAAPGSTSSRLLLARRLSAYRTRSEVEALAGRGALPVEGEIRLTPGSKAAIDGALEEADAWGDTTVDDRHLLASLTRIDDGIAARLFANAGIDGAELREALRQAGRGGATLA